MKKSKKSSQESNQPHPYDFSFKKDTKHTKSTAKAIRPDLMASGMIKAHGVEKAKRVVEPLTVKSFKDGQGNPVAVNETSNYWITVLQYLNKGLKNAAAS